MATQQKIRRTRQSSSARIGCLFAGFIHYLSLTSLSENGFRGLRFMISDSASSYARDMAGTWAAAKQTHIKTKREGSMRAGGGGRRSSCWDCGGVAHEEHIYMLALLLDSHFSHILDSWQRTTLHSYGLSSRSHRLCTFRRNFRIRTTHLKSDR